MDLHSVPGYLVQEGCLETHILFHRAVCGDLGGQLWSGELGFIMKTNVVGAASSCVVTSNYSSSVE